MENIYFTRHQHTGSYFFSDMKQMNTVMLFKITRPKDGDFLVLCMFVGTKDRAISVEIASLGMPLFEF